MPSLFSDHFNSDGTVGPGEGALTEELGLDTQRRISAGKAHARTRRSHARITVGSAVDIGDEIRMLSLKSSDRLFELFASSDGGTTAGAFDVGLYKSGLAHDGALPSTNSVDCFSTTAVTATTVVARVDAFKLGDFDEENRGLQLWELVNISDAATYAADPGGQFDLVLTATIAFTVTVCTLQYEAFYTAGD